MCLEVLWKITALPVQWGVSRTWENQRRCGAGTLGDAFPGIPCYAVLASWVLVSFLKSPEL